MSKEKLIDLDRDQLDLLHTILQRHIPGKTIWAYGSRATWKATETSDLDLAVFDCDPMQIYDLKEALEESDLLISVDVIDWESIPDDFKESIRGKYVVLQDKPRHPVGWREVKLGEVAEVIGGGTPNTSVDKYWNGDIPWLTPRDLSTLSGCYVSKGERSISESGLSKSSAKLLPKGTVLLSTRAPVGYLAIAKCEVSTNQGFRSLIPNEKTDSSFLFYLLKQNVPYLQSQSEGTTFGELAGSTLKSLSFLFPALPEQKAIAEVLSSLDDKIDLLHRQNKTLEDMAQAFFRESFMKIADDRWGKRPLSYFGDVICGKTPSKKLHEYFGGNIPFIKIPDMHGKTFVFDTDDTLTVKGKNSQNNKTLPPKSICVSCIATVGLVSMNAFECQTNQQINSIVPMKDEYRYYLYLFMKSSKNLLEAMASGGTATMNLNTGNFAKIMVPIADEKLMSWFHDYVSPLFEKIFFNQSQIRALESLRVNLLPKLMSGQARVNY